MGKVADTYNARETMVKRINRRRGKSKRSPKKGGLKGSTIDDNESVWTDGATTTYGGQSSVTDGNTLGGGGLKRKIPKIENDFGPYQ